MAEKEKKPMKGDIGKNTGSEARSLINKAQKKGMSNSDIAKKTNRDETTISSIDTGEIKNPPESLIPKLRKAASSSVTKDTMDAVQEHHNNQVKKRGHR